MRVLLVENHAFTLTTLTAALSGWNLDVRGCSAAREALREVADFVPEVAVLDLEEAQPEALQKIRDEIACAIRDDRAEAIVLGCAGMADLAQSMSLAFGVPVLDGLACAITLCEGMVRLGVRTSRVGGYAPPPAAKLELPSHR